MFFEDVQSALDPLALGGAWFADNATEPLAQTPEGDQTAPYIVWQPIVSLDQVTLDGPSGLQNTRLQVDCYAPRVADAQRLCRLADVAMRMAFTTVPLSLTPMYDPVVELHRFMRDYSVWHAADPEDDLRNFQSTLYAPGVGRVFNGAIASSWTHSLQLSDTGAVSAVGLVEGTNDPKGLTGWTLICTLSPAGTGTASDAPVPPVALHNWLRLRHRLVSLTGSAAATAQFNTEGF